MVVFKPEPIIINSNAAKDLYFKLLAKDKVDVFLELRMLFKEEIGIEQFCTAVADAGIRFELGFKK